MVLPATFTVGTLNHSLLRLRQPADLDVESCPGGVIVTLPTTGDWGVGPHLTAAVEDWQQTVVELYWTLQAEQGQLGPAMVALWAQLQTLIEVRA